MADRSFARVPTAIVTLVWSLGALVGAATWLGCGSSTETTPGAEDEGSGLPPSRTTGGEDPPPDAPPFQAQFDDAGTDAGKDAGSEGGTSSTCSDPNDAPAGVGKALPATDDCQDSNLTVNGIAASAVDEDVYTLSITDKTGCLVEPGFSLDTSKMQMCVFVQCKTPTTDAVSGCSDGTLSTDPNTSLKGCCRTDPGALTPNWNCSGADDSADLTFRLKPNPGAPACQAYSFKYHF